MHTNPLLAGQPRRVRLTPLEIVAQGNAIIAQEGRTDIEWVLRDGKPSLQWKRIEPRVSWHNRADLA